MDARILAAVLLIAGFLAIALSSVVGAPGLYDSADIGHRMLVIETYRSRWLMAQASVELYGVLTLLGFAALAAALRARGPVWLPTLGAVALAAGMISAMVFVYLQTTNPESGYSGGYPLPEALAYWLSLAGLFLFGIAFLQADLPAWLGYLAAGGAAVYALIYLVTGAGFMAPFVIAAVQLVVGIFSLRW